MAFLPQLQASEGNKYRHLHKRQLCVMLSLTHRQAVHPLESTTT
ncbi:hypothetical protein HMPREF1981_01809 [Bacteroides pyogenes F0041]|uniref:Uncharacterized protein n=1 Tax=Bacteroides pyogenes F0041 TaxID=1321819 RepID=U2DZJ5_9BACE|nr:hypothetical protein HMPREF1981_01809 [Bacteroides pyogenes F0041]